MAKKQYDGVIEAVRYAENGRIALVRLYERRGPTFSDHVLWTREELLKRMKAKQRLGVGQRVPYLSSTFQILTEVRLEKKLGYDVLLSGPASGIQDELAGAPVF